MTFIGALRFDRIEAPCVLDQPVNRRSFLQYVKQFLVPTLGTRDVGLMDNLNSHKNREVRRTIRATGAKLWLLPALQSGPQPDRAGVCQTQELLRTGWTIGKVNGGW